MLGAAPVPNSASSLCRSLVEARVRKCFHTQRSGGWLRGLESRCALQRSFVGLVGLVVIVIGSNGSAQAAAPTWRIVPTPNATNLSAVTTISGTSNLWAVGYAGAPSAVIERWSGSAWVKMAAPAGNDDNLRAVTSIAPNNAWAVGQYQGSTGLNTLVEHWNGSTWGSVPSPNVGNQTSLTGVAALAANDVWAVGYSDHGPLIEHWDGTSWSVSVDQTGGGGLQAVARVPGTNQLWAVGGSNGSVVTEHYINHAWEKVGAPPGGLFSVVAVSARSVWAAGQYFDGVANRTQTMHWNGATWSAISTPNLGSAPNALDSITRVPKTNQLWAVGFHYTSTGDYRTLTMRWVSGAWRIVSSIPADTTAALLGVVARGPKDVWAVGYTHNDTTGYDTLSEHYR